VVTDIHKVRVLIAFGRGLWSRLGAPIAELASENGRIGFPFVGKLTHIAR
jgi:hypothetical protein